MNPNHPFTEQPTTPQVINERISLYFNTPVQFQQAIVTSDIGGVLTIYQSTDSSFMQLLYTQVNAMLFVLRPLDEGGQPFGSLLSTMPRSLAQGQLCRIVWREQTIALSIHEHPAGQDERVSQDIAYMQKLAAFCGVDRLNSLYASRRVPLADAGAPICPTSFPKMAKRSIGSIFSISCCAPCSKGIIARPCA